MPGDDQARLLLTSASDERAASVVILGPGSQSQLVYQAAVVNARGYWDLAGYL